MQNLWRGKPQDNNDKDRVKDATDIVRLVGEHVALRPKGREFVGLCPFHNDKNPSMNVIPAKQIFHCFVCSAGGDAFSFVQKFHKMEFREALEYLAERAGIELTKWKPAGGHAEGGGETTSVSRADLLSANATASEFFRGILRLDHGKDAREVVGRRGISPEMVEKFLIGASPDRWDGLLLTIQSKRMDPRAFFDAGLIKKRDGSEGAYDALRNRLIFPIQDQIGRVIAFGGRKIKDEDEPKYLNSPETRLFNKSATLYALNHAAKAIQGERTALITEGYTDAIACHQAGFANAVATLGTALTREHASVLRRLCDRIVLLFDGDEAGQRAADRAVEVFFAEDLDVAICTLNRFTTAKDPDELLKREGGSETFRTAVAASTDLLEFRFERLRTRLEGAGMAALARGIKEEIARLVDLGLKDVEPIRQRLIVKRLAQVAGVDEGTITAAIPAGRRPRTVVQDGQGESEEPTTGDAGPEAEAPMPPLASASLPAPVHMLGCILCDTALLSTLSEHERDFIAPGAYPWALLRRVAQVVHDLGEETGVADLGAVLRAVEELDVKDTAVGLASRIDQITDRDRNTLHAHWQECLKRVHLDHNQSRSGQPKSGEINNEDLQQLIELKRTSQASFGANRRVFPKSG